MITPVLVLIAGLEQQVTDCRAIADDAQRLACYDALTASPTPAPAAPAASSFGGSTVPRAPVDDEPKQIEAHLTATVNGWRKGTLFPLDNGQVWQCVDDDRSDDVLDHAAVTIKRNFMGHYWMSISRWQTVQVIRIK